MLNPELEIITPLGTKVMHCPACGIDQTVQRGVGWALCVACKPSWDPVTTEERLKVMRQGIPFQRVMAARSKAISLAVTNDRLCIPARFWHATANARVAKWAEGRTTRLLVLTGPVGTGKSWQACGALRSVIARTPGEAHLVNCANLARIERDGFRVYSQCKILALDDLGARLTPAALATAYELIEYRHSHLLPMIITTNLSPLDIRKVDERIASRLGAGTWIEIAGSDRRLA